MTLINCARESLETRKLSIYYFVKLQLFYNKILYYIVQVNKFLCTVLKNIWLPYERTGFNV